MEQRRRLEFPWLKEENGRAGERESGRAGEQESRRAGEQESGRAGESISAPQAFVLELGSEELPPQDVVDGIAQIEEKLKVLLSKYRLRYEGLRVTGTPRRLVAFIADLAPQQADEVVEKRGPSVAQAYDSFNRPTKALEGFARGQGVSPEQIEVRDNYVYAVKRVAGRPTLEVLPALCLELLDGLRWGKAMRWNSSGVAYPRPLRWIVAL
ncbi:MAG: glycine--tRNA ligase subunit beta, partial [Caldilineaceae bacterium]|nr:glycine--tRNA ligase subunit beta [Caldilineaceae bacterium]